MKLRQGCGCPILILMAIDLFFFVGVIVSFINPDTEPVRATMLGSVLSLVVFAGNVIVCALLAIAAFRKQGLQSSTEETSLADEYASEGTDEERGTDEDA